MIKKLCTRQLLKYYHKAYSEPLVLGIYKLFYVMEIWKDIKDYEGLYKVSNLGNIKSIGRYNKRGYELRSRVKKLTKRHDGYLVVSLSNNGLKKTKTVHRLVMLSFIPNPNNLSEINHIDEDKSNNILSNLEWSTTRYNTNYSANRKSTSKYSGVCWSTFANKWVSYCRMNNQQNYLGLFDKEENAAQAYICFCAIHDLK